VSDAWRAVRTVAEPEPSLSRQIGRNLSLPGQAGPLRSAPALEEGWAAVGARMDEAWRAVRTVTAPLLGQLELHHAIVSGRWGV
jgi:hypothetical protein